jgi:two-component system chemotaxis sensor kinase CheA
MSDEQNSQAQNGGMDIPITIDFEQVEQVANVFFEESKSILADLDKHILKFEANPEDSELVNMLFRKVHTLKGSVGAVPGGQLFGSLAHEFEALLNRIKRESLLPTKECIDLFLQSTRLLKILADALHDKRELFPEELSEVIETITKYGSFSFGEGTTVVPASAKSKQKANAGGDDDDGVWLSKKQINEILRLSGELFVLKNFYQVMNTSSTLKESPGELERRQGDFSHSLNKICDQFQTELQSIRKEKAEVSLQGLPLLVRQSSTELNKSVQLQIEGADLLIDKGLGKDLMDILVHLVRNSIDHGIEDQFERAVNGKNSEGQLKLQLQEKNGLITMEFSDDGKGLDKERILAKALSSQIVKEEDVPKLSEQDIFKFIFNAGFSTKEKVTTISGRGVGMDVVLATVDKYVGKIHVESKPNEGTCFKFEMPSPQHIMVETTLLCQWESLQIAVPLSSVAQISSTGELQFTKVDRMRFCQHQGLTIPLLSYQEILSQKIITSEEKVKNSAVVYLRSADLNFALLVDKVDAQTDLVVKPFGKIVGEQTGFKGISILADERVTYILDPENLAAALKSSNPELKVAA